MCYLCPRLVIGFINMYHNPSMVLEIIILMDLLILDNFLYYNK